VEQVNFHPFFLEGIDGLLAATGFVFVSYAGVTKIASIAEEVENPGRNIPLGILGSIAIMMLIYTAIVFVIVGVTDATQLGKSLTPMAIVAEQFLGSTGVVVITITAVLALTGMANAGVLSSSRYPFAMSRNNLAPEVFKQINVKFKTPVFSIGITGGLLLLLIAFVPVVELAKLASAFQLLVFSLVNVALIVFRESNLESYKPTFRSPGYPWVQLFGILGGVVLLTQMGTFPMLGAVGIIVGGIAWYQFYGKSRTTQKGVALRALRQSIASRNLAEAEAAIAQNTPSRILIPVHPYITLEEKETLVQIAADLVRKQGGEVQVVRLIEVPKQMSLQAAAEVETQEDIEFVALVEALAQKYGVQIEAHELVSHDLNQAVVNYTRENQINLIIGEVEARLGQIPLFGNDVEWLMDHVPCDSIFVKNRGVGKLRKIAVIGENRPYESVEIVTANTIAVEHGAGIHFIHALKTGASDAQVAALKSHHEEVAKLCFVPTSSQVIRVDKRVDALKEITSEFDLIIVNASTHHFSSNHIFGDFTDRMAQHMNCSVLLAHDKNAHRHTFLWQALQRVIH
jgi:nucleotide-binding universal stress UspA family protein